MVSRELYPLEDPLYAVRMWNSPTADENNVRQSNGLISWLFVYHVPASYYRVAAALSTFVAATSTHDRYVVAVQEGIQ